MAERFTDIHSPERSANKNQAEKLELKTSAEKPTDSGEVQDRDKSLETAREQLKKVEHQPEPEPTEKPKDREPTTSLTKKQQKEKYARQMDKVRAQLPPRSRTFSKVVHNRVVEDVSEFVEDTVMRPPLLITGSVIGLSFSVVVYIFAQVQGFRLSGSEVVIGFAVGWLLGAIGETIVRNIKRKPKQ